MMENTHDPCAITRPGATFLRLLERLAEEARKAERSG
jgi:hypothetical protein